MRFASRATRLVSEPLADMRVVGGRIPVSTSRMMLKEGFRPQSLATVTIPTPPNPIS